MNFLVRHRLGGPLLLVSIAANLTNWRLGDWLAGLLLGLGTWAWFSEEAK